MSLQTSNSALNSKALWTKIVFARFTVSGRGYSGAKRFPARITIVLIGGII